jgi:GT2 family glycosyltransferase/glycosyltransferase involved in cell wall biosynthesis
MPRPSIRVPSVDIILGVYNKPALAYDCIGSLLQNTRYPNWKALLIDDAGDSFTQKMLADCAKGDPRIQLIRNPENRGFIGTYNYGMQLSRADYVLLLNSDTILTPGWLDKLVAHAESDPQIGMVNPLSNELANLSLPMAPGASYLAMNAFLERHHAGECFDVVTCVGFCLLIRRAALEQLGFLDEVFGTGYCEDSDLHMRLTTHGWRGVVAADTYIYHMSHGTFGTAAANASYQKNIQIFRQRWGAQYDKALRAFQASGHFDALQNEFVPSRINDLIAADPKGLGKVVTFLRRPRLMAEGARNEIRFALRYPRRAFTRWHDRLRGSLSRRTQPAAPWYLCTPRVRSPKPTRPDYGLFSKSGAPSVLFLLPELDDARGCQKIIQLVNRLILQGLDARLAVSSPADFPRELLQHALFEPMLFPGPEALLDQSPCCDAVVATSWTVARVARELVSRGRVQTAIGLLHDSESTFDHEPRLRSEVFEAFAGLEHRIATSDWLGGLLRQHDLDCQVIPHGLNSREFYPSPKPQDVPLRIIAEARPQSPDRGFATLRDVLTQVHQERPEVELALFGCNDLARHLDSSLPVLDHGVVTDREALRRHYGRADVFLDLSDFPVFSQGAMEAMACQIACVLTDAGSVTPYVRDGLNSILVPPRAPDRSACAVLRLLDDAQLRQRLAGAGRETVQRMTPEDEAQAWVEYLAATCPSIQQKLAS